MLKPHNPPLRSHTGRKVNREPDEAPGKPVEIVLLPLALGFRYNADILRKDIRLNTA